MRVQLIYNIKREDGRTVLTRLYSFGNFTTMGMRTVEPSSKRLYSHFFKVMTETSVGLSTVEFFREMLSCQQKNKENLPGSSFQLDCQTLNGALRRFKPKIPKLRWLKCQELKNLNLPGTHSPVNKARTSKSATEASTVVSLSEDWSSLVSILRRST